MNSVAKWPRAFFQPTGQDAHINVVAFGNASSIDSLKPSAEDGWPATYDWPETLTMRVYDLNDTEQRELFLPMLEGSIRDRAPDVLGESAVRLDTAHYAFCIEGALDDPRDLAHLQATHAILRCLARQNDAFAALNEKAIEWVDLHELARSAPPPRMQVSDWVRVVAEVKPDPRFGRVLHTRGLIQFGRPDLMILGFADEVLPAAVEAIETAAAALAKGGQLRTDDPFLVGWNGGERLEATVEILTADENGPDVALGNDAFVLRMDSRTLKLLEDAIDAR